MTGENRGDASATSRPYTPQELAKGVLRILTSCQGQGKAIKRAAILQLVRQSPYYRQANDRAIRTAIEELREAGQLICNMINDEGYFMASNPSEYQAFRTLYSSYAKTILARVSEMDKQAARRWGSESLQPELFVCTE